MSVFPSSQVPSMHCNQNLDHPHPDPHSHLATTAVFRANDHPSSSFSNHMATNSGPLHDLYLHSSFVASPSRFPLPNFNQQVHGMVKPQLGIARTSFKRKSPAMSLASSVWNTSGCYTAGSSSNLHIPNNLVQPKPMMGSWPLDPASSAHNHGSDDLLTPGEEFQRNVRCRHNHSFQVDTNPSSNRPRHLHAAGNLSGLSAEVQFSYALMPVAPKGRIFSSGPSFSHGKNQSLTRPNTTTTTVGTPSSLPTPHGPLTQGVEAGSSGYNQRSHPYRPSSSYMAVGFDNASWEGDGPTRMESVASSRYSRPLAIAGRNSHGNGRTRSSYSRFQLNYVEDTVPSRWLSEDAVMMGRSTIYDSGNFFDQHRDMRLDVDNMSYEELLSLGERIGVVSTGLSEETIARCLQETTRYSSNQIEGNREEGRCVICLEGYEDLDKVGRLNCRHDFHVGCIKNWLLIKNVCPICKAAALRD